MHWHQCHTQVVTIVTISGHHDDWSTQATMARPRSAVPADNDAARNRGDYSPGSDEPDWPDGTIDHPAFNPQLLRESFTIIEPVAAKAMAYFFGRMFADYPQLRGMFLVSSGGHGERFLQTMRHMLSLENPQAVRTYLAQLGRDHRKFGVKAEHYEIVRDAFLATLERFAGGAWTDRLRSAWTAAFDLAAKIMIKAADEDAAHAPAWWLGEVLTHEPRGPDIAVLTVRPNLPLPHQAGQYVAVQCARWPRVWRTYSIANAPGADLLRFHVRAIPCGWVSGALVHQTQPGDVLVIGPATGTMIADTSSTRDVVCVAGGTGLAPIKAIVQQLIAHKRGQDYERGPKRRIHLFFGARRESDLYDLPELQQMESDCEALQVIPVISDEPEFGGLRGMLPTVVARFFSRGGHDVADHDVYVAGPAEMIRETAQILTSIGIPAARLHNDPVVPEPVTHAVTPCAISGSMRHPR